MIRLKEEDANMLKGQLVGESIFTAVVAVVMVLNTSMPWLWAFAWALVLLFNWYSLRVHLKLLNNGSKEEN